MTGLTHIGGISTPRARVGILGKRRTILGDLPIFSIGHSGKSVNNLVSPTLVVVSAQAVATVRWSAPAVPFQSVVRSVSAAGTGGFLRGT